MPFAAKKKVIEWEPTAGEVLAGRFELRSRLGVGGMGQVWLADDHQMDGAPTACKLLKPALCNNRQAVADLKREVLVTRKLRHPNIVPVFTYWDDENRHFISMEYIEGACLALALREASRAYTPDDVMPWIEQMAAALDYAHSKGVLHCDVKPSNMLLEHDQIHLADFGIARAIFETETEKSRRGTQGTLAYMSPEQIQSGRIDGRADQYGLAVTVYELLSFTLPFTGDHIATDIQFNPPPRLAHLSEGFNEVLQRAMAKSRHERYSNCAEFVRALQQSDRTCTGSVAIEARPEEEEKETEVLFAVDIETRRSRLGRLLIESKMIGQGDLADALLQQQKTGEKLGSTLVAMGFLTEEQLTDCLSRQMDVPAIDLDNEAFDPSVLEEMPDDFASDYLALPVRREGESVIVAMADPLDIVALSGLEDIFGTPIVARLAPARDIREHLARLTFAAT